MSPIDRVAQRTHALSVLGVPSSATRSDIRSAFRKLAFEKHPDQHPECNEEFSRITEAYRFVCDHADELGIQNEPANDPAPITPNRVSRPRVRPEETEFDADTTAECEALLAAEGGEGTQHVAASLYRVGRNLTYFVRTPMVRGRNEVAVPTGMLHDTRRVLPRILAFESRDALGGFFDMPAEICSEHFPGARRVQIRFSAA